MRCFVTAKESRSLSLVPGSIERMIQAFVEEKNGSVVRRLIGYDRYEGLGAWRALIQLYEILRLYVNFFQPSMKLIEKQRDGARVKKRYDRAQTPLPARHRLCLSHQAEEGANREFVPEAGSGNPTQRARATPRPFLDLC